MTTKNNDNDWYNDLANASKLLFDADKTTLERLGKDWKDDSMWKNFATITLNAKIIIFDNANAVIDKFKKEIKSYNQIQQLDFEDIKAKNGLLKATLNEVASTQSGDKRLTFSLKLETGRENEAWAVVLIAYIQSQNRVQTNKEFAQEFIKQTKCLDVIEDKHIYVEPTAHSPVQSPSEENKRTETSQFAQKSNIATPPQSQNRTLILIFGQSQWEGVNEIKNKTEFDNGDYELLKRYEWFWYGVSESHPAEIPNDEQGNMCWLQLDTRSNNMFEVKERSDFIELIDKIKKQQVIVTQMKAGGLFQLATSGLSGKGFIKA